MIIAGLFVNLFINFIAIIYNASNDAFGLSFIIGECK